MTLKKKFSLFYGGSLPKKSFSVLEIGGLQVSSPKMILDGLRQNLLQKAYNIIKNNNTTTMTDIIELELRSAQHPP